MSAQAAMVLCALWCCDSGAMWLWRWCRLCCCDGGAGVVVTVVLAPVLALLVLVVAELALAFA